jgi:ACS family hexuronate transporter-like MFS transporter
VTIPKTTPAASGTRFQIPHLRWYICSMLLLGAAINYVDRQTFSILAPDLQKIIGWNELEYSRLVNAFQIAYAIMNLGTGWFIDRVGTRWGLALALIWWSIAEIGHAFASTVMQFGVARFFLGAGEAASMPASIKAIGEWFPKAERAVATGLLNAFTTGGAVIAPVVVPLAAATWGWQGAFIATGALGLLWLVGWLGLYDLPERHPRLTDQERALIQGSGPRPKTTPVSWISLLKYRQLWAYAGARILTDPVYWFFLYWTPKYLAETHRIRGTAAIPYLTTAFALSGVGSIIGGVVSSALIKRGWTVNRSRKTAMFGVAAFIPLVVFANNAADPWTAALLIGLALSVHQGWAANNFAMILDLFPARFAATVFGIGGSLGLLSAIVAAEVVGRILQGDPRYYLPMFLYSGAAYLLGTLWIHLLAPKLEPADLQ